ncbi:hypothetical protein RF11_16244 [Thelohanellus kitauei]|uniref:FLYWCH-type domain-containing protein n=1 Tax=Thelohanellus kitauei TaxID=669202 RepID=A0A0C2MDQ5_THEKT|nr:hypothetical protein RF11_16244 [Thelohanellus kitauei]
MENSSNIKDSFTTAIKLIKKMYWRCIESHKNGCDARCKTINGSLLSSSGRHEHLANPSNAAAWVVINEIKAISVSTVQSHQEIIARATSNLNAAVISSTSSVR